MKRRRRCLENSRSIDDRIGRTLSEFRAAFVKDVKVFLRYPSWVASEFITTPLWFVFFALGVALYSPPGKFTQTTVGTPNTFALFYWGFLFLIIFSTSIWGIGQYIRTEQLQGTIEQLFLAPVSRVTIIFGRFLRNFFTDLVFLGYTIGLIALFTQERIPLHSPLLLIVILVAVEVSVLGFGLFFAGIAFKIKAFNLVANLTQFLVIGLCGLFIPVTKLPAPIFYVSLAFPFTYLTDMLRYSSTGSSGNGYTIFDPSFEVPLAIILSISMLIFGLAFFKLVEKNAQKHGTIGTH